MYGLNVSKIVGPPYAITKIEPALGQLSGGDVVTIHGQGFSFDTCTVLFTCGNTAITEPTKLSMSVVGTQQNETTLTCATPDFSQFAPRFDCVVQLMAGGQDVTTTWQKFTFFMNTRASKSLCYGPGLLNDLSTHEPAVFIIQARNDNCENRTSGRDQFEVKIICEDDGKELDKESISIVDKDDGSYHVNYHVTRPTKVNIKVSFKDDKGKFVEVRGSPYTASFVAQAEKHANSLTGPHLNAHLTNEIANLQAFMKETAQGANIKDKDITDVKVLIGVKDKIDEVKNKNDDLQLQLDQLEETLRMLSSHNVPKDKQMKEYKKLTDDFTSLKKLAKDMEREIKKNVEQETSNNAKQIQALEDTMKKFTNDLKKREFYQYKTGRETAVQKLKDVRTEIADLEKKIEDFGFNAQKFA